MGLSMPGNVWYTIPVIQRNRPTGRREGGFMLQETLAYEVLSVVEEIPRLIGRPRNARLVGRILRGAEQYGSYPCHRVVNHAGRLAPGWPEQAALLAAEGVFLNQRGCVDLARDQWDC